MTHSSAKLPDVKIPRNIRLRYERFLDHFKGFENVDAVRGIFGPKTKPVLRALKVEWMDASELRRLARNVGVKAPRSPVADGNGRPLGIQRLERKARTSDVIVI